jgi:hypothetical protein
LKGEEAALIASVRDNYIAAGLSVTDSDLCEIAMNAFLLKYQVSTAETPMFQCSAGFTANFKGRQYLTSRRVHFKFRPPVTKNQRQTGLATIRALLQNVQWNRIINCGETFWLLHPNGIFTGRKYGRDQYKQISQEMKKRTSQSSRL